MQDSAGQPGRKHREDPGTKRTTTARRLTGKEERISFKDDIPGWYRVLWRWGQEVLTAHLTLSDASPLPTHLITVQALRTSQVLSLQYTDSPPK